MESVHEVLQGENVDGWTVVVLTAASCMLGVLWLLFRSDGNKHEVLQKIQRAQIRSRESLQRAEQKVNHYRSTHPATNSTKISSLSFSELTKKLQDGTLSPEEVYYTFMEQTLALNRKVNCCTEILLESFDQLKTVKTKKDGLLYGVPVSIKDNVSYKNYDSSCGLANNLEKPAGEDSVLVEVLKRQGAIPFVKTNIPQAMVSYDCTNPIYGETVNPLNPKRSPGGSSGGEGALIGGGGSVLGIGSDIGGSIRVPAAFCGVCGFKPTAGRLSLKGVELTLKGQMSVMATVGPLAREVDGLARFMQAVLCDHMFTLDPTVPPMPFNMQIYESSKPLRIGYMECDGFTQSTPSMVRCLRETKALLEKAGHTLVPYQPLRIEYAMYKLVLKGLMSDKSDTLLAKVRDVPLDPAFAQQIFPYRFPMWFRKTLSFLLKPLSGRTSAILNCTNGVGSVANLWKHHANVQDYISETIELWKRCNIDVLLSPVIGPACHCNVSSRITPVVSCAMLYNLLNFPAGVVPVSTVTVEDEEELKLYQGFYQDRFDQSFKEAVSGGEGLPLAVQCVALPWQEELCLRFMREVEKLVKENRS